MRAILMVLLCLCALANAHCVQVVEVQVTAVFSECFYVEEYDRSAGIAVIYAGTAPTPGDLLYMSGYVTSLLSGERVFMAETIQVDGYCTEEARVHPLVLPNRAIGGASASPYTPGVVGSTGLNNIGLLAATSGKVTRVESGRFFITDGHTTEIGVVVEGGLTAPAVDSYVLVTGIVTMDDLRNPMLRPRSVADVADFGICSVPAAPMSTGGTSTLSTGTYMGILSLDGSQNVPNDHGLPPFLPPSYGQQ